VVDAGEERHVGILPNEGENEEAGVAADTDPVIIGGARTPIGRLLGALSSFSGAELGGLAITGALADAGVAPDAIEYVIMGQVLQAGAGQIPPRQAAVKAGIPMTVPATSLNKVCLSGLDAIAQAAQLIRLGEFEVIVAGGMESMSQAPHLLQGSRKGFKFGPAELADSMQLDGLTDPFDHVSMGESTERFTDKLGISRAEQDEFAARSQQRAAAATKDGRLAHEIVPVSYRDAEIVEDEGIRSDTSVESLSRLRPAFASSGTITAGNSSQISDGAAAVVVTSRGKAASLGATVLAEIGSWATVAGPDNSLLSQPSRAIIRALAKAGRTSADLNLIEINEAFAAVAIQSVRELGVDPELVNVNGGAIALGHPLGASGTRIVLTLAKELHRRGGGFGAAGLCGGGGQGSALLLTVPGA
jgi:acetyl-CoA C-acetyltransferase